MPNWVSHKITCTGSKNILEQLLQGITTTENNDTFIDFNRIIPMPALVFDGALTSEQKDKMPNRNWYEWSLKHWGTKWNACHSKIGKITSETLIIYFDTAWSLPEPVLEQLAWLFPELRFDILYIEEGCSFAGHMTFEKGALKNSAEMECGEDNPDFIELYKQVYDADIDE